MYVYLIYKCKPVVTVASFNVDILVFSFIDSINR